jgi:glycosyltransferase involved in cell wall biosynthesis
MLTYFAGADLYVSMSEHEGFGKPLLESMLLGLPILAYAASAVPFTLGRAGVLFRAKAYEALAELVDIMIKDQALRRRIIAGQKERARAFLEPNVRQVLATFLRELGLPVSTRLEDWRKTGG